MDVNCSTQDGYRLLHRGARALAQVENEGIGINTEYLAQAIQESEAKVTGMEKELESSKVMSAWRKKFGDTSNLNSRPQLSWVIKNVLGIDLEATDGGNYKTDKTALSKINHPFVKDYLELGTLKRTINTFLYGIQREIVDDRLHPFFNLHTVATYRSSSDSPNFQNFPVRDPEIGPLIRRAFVPSPGCKLIEADYGGIEVRISACYHHDPNMISYIRNPEKDMHRDMAMQCFALPQEEVTKKIRYVAKNQFVFPQFYGDWYQSCAQNMWESVQNEVTVSGKLVPLHLKEMGFRKLGIIDISTPPVAGSFADHIRKIENDFWKRRFKVYDKWKKNWYATYQKRGYIELLTGFVCRGLMDRKQATNYPIQGSAFHCLLWSLSKLVLQELRRYKLKSRVVGQIHDSIISEVPDDEVESYKELVHDVMIRQLQKEWQWIIVPLEVEFTSYSDSWAVADK